MRHQARFVVSGSRNWTNQGFIHDRLAELRQHLISTGEVADASHITIVHGGARGADALAAAAATSLGMNTEAHPADWKRWGKAAGMRRNREMIDSGCLGVIAFPMPDSIGTLGAIGYAQRRGLPVTQYMGSYGSH